jgi:hypothetical protein
MNGLSRVRTLIEADYGAMQGMPWADREAHIHLAFIGPIMSALRVLEDRPSAHYILAERDLLKRYAKDVADIDPKISDPAGSDMVAKIDRYLTFKDIVRCSNYDIHVDKGALKCIQNFYGVNHYINYDSDPHNSNHLSELGRDCIAQYGHTFDIYNPSTKATATLIAFHEMITNACKILVRLFGIHVGKLKNPRSMMCRVSNLIYVVCRKHMEEIVQIPDNLSNPDHLYFYGNEAKLSLMRISEWVSITDHLVDDRRRN